MVFPWDILFSSGISCFPLSKFQFDQEYEDVHKKLQLKADVTSSLNIVMSGICFYYLCLVPFVWMAFHVIQLNETMVCRMFNLGILDPNLLE